MHFCGGNIHFEGAASRLSCSVTTLFRVSHIAYVQQLCAWQFTEMAGAVLSVIVVC